MVQAGERLPALLVRVGYAGYGVPPRLYVNSRAVSWEDLDAVLNKELRLRPPTWPVYLEGDPAIEWGHAVKAMDVIRGLHAEVVLLTGKATPRRGRSEQVTKPNTAEAPHPARR